MTFGISEDILPICQEKGTQYQLALNCFQLEFNKRFCKYVGAIISFLIHKAYYTIDVIKYEEKQFENIHNGFNICAYTQGISFNNNTKL